MLISNLLKKFLKNAPKKSLTNMSKSGKSAYFYHIFANNCFFGNFRKKISTDRRWGARSVEMRVRLALGGRNAELAGGLSSNPFL